MPDFRTTCHIHAAVLTALFAFYLALPAFPLRAFGQEGAEAARFWVRRSGVVFLAFAAMLMLVRDLPRSLARQAIAIGMVIFWGGLATFGAVAILTGASGWTAWATVAAEVALGALFLPHLSATET